MFLMLALPCAAQGQAQNPAPRPGQTGEAPPHILRRRSELVVVPVTIKDRRGGIIGDLRREEFHIFEEGREQQMAMFSTDPFPLSIALVIDNDLEVRLRDQVQNSLAAITAGIGPADEAAILTYGEFPLTVLDFTSNSDEIFTKLRRLELGSSNPGGYGAPVTSGPIINSQSQTTGVPTVGLHSDKVIDDLDDAVHAAAEMLRARGRDRRKIIFLISDGVNSRYNKWSFDQTLQLMLSADISVYTVKVGSKLFKHDPGRMAKYAEDTGGDAFFASKEKDLDRIYSNLTEEARNQYTLAYVPLNPAKSNYHAIEVRVERPHLRILARQGYYVVPVR